MFQLDLKSRKSIYEQVIDNLRELILSGALNPGAKLPSVRDLSKTLTVNPNTVQKAYRELERQSYVYTVSGLGTFVDKAESRKTDEALKRGAMELVRRGVRELYYSGMARDEILAFLEELPDSTITPKPAPESAPAITPETTPETKGGQRT
ncbi:MAG: GntR family transcriptional regulator [Clostridiales Family XIII bacterium]|jgi:GntR family transcriptional regulator|nr:GntR family transcriptional regulator [Clostridiales Family XIII bacterium]